MEWERERERCVAGWRDWGEEGVWQVGRDGVERFGREVCRRLTGGDSVERLGREREGGVWQVGVDGVERLGTNTVVVKEIWRSIVVGGVQICIAVHGRIMVCVGGG